MLKLTSKSSSTTLSSLGRSTDYIDTPFPKDPPSQPYRHKINIDNLISICTAKLSLNPNHKKALFIRATSLMKKKMFQEAIDDSYRLLNIDSHNVGAYYIIGCAYEKLDEV